MAMKIFSCTDGTVSNFSQNDCSRQIKEAKMLLLASSDVELPLDSTDESSITDLIAEKKLQPIPVKNLEADNSAEDPSEEINGKMEYSGLGQYRYQFSVRADQCSYKGLASQSNRFAGVFIVDKQDFIMGILSNDKTKLIPLSVDQFFVGKAPLVATYGVSPKYLVNLHMDAEIISYSNAQYIDSGINFGLNIDGLKDVDIIEADGKTSTTTNLYVKVVLDCGNTDVEGLGVGDFEVIGTSGEITPTGITESNGVYDIAGTFPSGKVTVGLKKPSAQTSKKYDDGGQPLEITVS